MVEKEKSNTTSSKESKEAKNTSNTKNFSPKPIIEAFIEKKLTQNLFAFEDFQLPWLQEDFEDFLQNYHPEHKQEILSINYKIMLQRMVIESSVGIKDMFQNLIQSIGKEYVLSPEYESKIKDFFLDKKKSDLKYYLSSQLGRKKLLKQLKISTTQKDQDDDILLKNIFWRLDVKAFKNDNEKMSSLHSLIKHDFIQVWDLQNLISWLDKKYIHRLFAFFLPTISLQDAEKLWLLSKKDTDKRIKELLETYELSEKDIESMLPSFEKDEIFISTRDLFSSKNGSKLIENHQFLQKIVKEWNDTKVYFESSQEIQDKTDFFNAITKNKIIKPEIIRFFEWVKENPEKLDSFVITINGKKQYYCVASFPNNSSEFDIINITQWSGVKKEKDKWKKEKMFFSSFLELLEHLSNTKDTNIEFFSQEEFKQKNVVAEIPERENIESVEALELLLDEIDPKGKWIKVEDMAFYYTPLTESSPEESERRATKEDILFVQWVKDQIITLSNGQKLTFDQFYNAFEDIKPKRFQKLDTSSKFLDQLKKDDSFKGLFKDIELKDNKFIPKSQKDNDEYKWMQYLISEWENQPSIYIKSIKDTQIYIEEWEYKESQEEKDKKGKVTKKPDTFTKKRYGWMDYTTFYHYLKDKKFALQKEPKEVEDWEVKKAKELKTKRWFFKSWFSTMSIKEMLAAGKQVTSAIEHYLEQWNKLKSAQFALAMGKFLPEWVRKDLENMVEWEQKKTMEEIMSKLKAMNSAQMVDTIWKYLQSSRPWDPELEASVMTMVSKYGNLYNKMEHRRGNYSWYQALWWKVWDTLFMKVKQECLDAEVAAKEWWKPSPVPFTEERLVEALLAKQTSRKPEDDVYKPKRRHKFDKDYGSALKSGLAEEIQDWENKAWDKITLKWRMEYVLGEFVAWWYANGIWWLKKVWSKGGTAKEMNALPFVLSVTGLSKSFTEDLLWKVINEAWGSPYSMMIFNSKPSALTVFQDTVSHLLATKPAYVGQGLASKYQTALSPQLPWQKKTVVEKVYDFWMTYGDEIVKDLNTSSWYLHLEKNKPWNEVFWAYYDFYTWVMTDDEYALKDEDISIGKYADEANPINPDIARGHYPWYFWVNSSGRFNKPTGQQLFDAEIAQIENIKNMKEEDITPGERFELYKAHHKALEPAIREGASATLDSPIFKKSIIASTLKRVGIDMIWDLFQPEDKDRKWKIWIYDYVDSDSYEAYIQKSFDRFMSDKPQKKVEETTQITPMRVNDILKNFQAANQEDIYGNKAA